MERISHAVDKIKKMWSRVGANVKIMSPEEHDQILAYISHLPHLVAYALMSTIPEEFLPFCRAGIKRYNTDCIINSRGLA